MTKQSAGTEKTNPDDTKEKNAYAAAAPKSESVDKIRELIFGSQMQDYDKRFARLESSVNAQIADLRAETKKWYDALENYIKKELGTLSSQISAEKTDRIAAGQAAAKELSEAEKTLKYTIDTLSDRVLQNEKELRQQLLDQWKDLRNEIAGSHSEMVNKLNSAAQVLGVEKTDRKFLADLLLEMAMRLNKEFKNNILESGSNE
jgi:hypothetical protein